MEIYLTFNEVADFLSITVQGLHKICRENELKTKYGSKHKIYPEVFQNICKIKGLKLDYIQARITSHIIKGGMGKTSVVHALASRAASLGIKTLVVDLDKQANLSNSFGIDEDQGYLTIFDVFKNIVRDKNDQFSVKEAIVPVSSFLHIIPADIEVANFDLEVLVTRLPVHDLFDELLGQIKDEYGLILFDLPADFNSITLAAHIFCGFCIIPMDLTGFAEKGVKLTKDHIKRAEKIGGKEIGFLLQGNFFDQRNSEAIDDIAKLKQQNKEQFSSVVIPICQPIKKSIGKGVYLWSMPKSKAPALIAFERLLTNIMDIKIVEACDTPRKDRPKNNSLVPPKMKGKTINQEVPHNA